MKIIGVTGQSGAGKSIICSILQEKYNAYIIDADEIAKELSKKGNKYFQEIVNYFGKDILNAFGGLERNKLANIIYENEEKRNALNNITFTHVVQEIKQKIKKLANEKLVVIDAPLLIESNLNQICDLVIGVIAKEEEKIKRICLRDNISKETAKKRLSIQITDEKIIKTADYIIINDANSNKLEKEILKIQDKLK